MQALHAIHAFVLQARPHAAPQRQQTTHNPQKRVPAAVRAHARAHPHKRTPTRAHTHAGIHPHKCTWVRAKIPGGHVHMRWCNAGVRVSCCRLTSTCHRTSKTSCAAGQQLPAPPGTHMWWRRRGCVWWPRTVLHEPALCMCMCVVFGVCVLCLVYVCCVWCMCVVFGVCVLCLVYVCCVWCVCCFVCVTLCVCAFA